jgi:hypothetical protein
MLNRIDKWLSIASKVSEREAWNYAVQSVGMQRDIRKWIISQLDEGINADEQIIGYYSPNNKQLKGRDTYDLDDTGLFRSTISAYGTPEAIIVVANGQKEDENIIDKFTVRIIELTDENLNKLRAFLLNEYLIYLNNVLYNN